MRWVSTSSSNSLYMEVGGLAMVDIGKVGVQVLIYEPVWIWQYGRPVKVGAKCELRILCPCQSKQSQRIKLGLNVNP